MTRLQAVPKSPLSEQEFVRRAIRVLPAKGSGHVGIAPHELEGSFKKHFRKSATQTINDVVREGEVVLVRLERAEGGDRGRHRLTQIKFLEALPTKKPKKLVGRLRLYNSDALPRPIATARAKEQGREGALEKILQE